MPGRHGRVWARRVVFALAAVVTLLVLFYAEENWRGKRAWEQCRAELEAKGEVLDWNAYIPKPVPDDQNFMKVPLMDSWFKRDTKNTNDLKRVSEMAQYDAAGRNQKVPLLEIRIWPANAADAPAQAVSLKEFDVQDTEAMRDALRRVGHLPMLNDPRGYVMLGGGPARTVPRLNARAADGLTQKWLEERLARFSFGIERLPEPDAIRVMLQSVVLAEDVVAWFKQFEADLDVLAEAVKRPYSRFDGDYSQPFFISIPNFISVRTVAQCLGARAQAHLLLGEPEAALRDLKLLGALINVLEGTQPTLVTAMIRVAVAGLYVAVLGDGLALDAWRASDQAALQQQLAGMNMLRHYITSLRGGERAAFNFMLERLPNARLAQALAGDEKRSTWLTLPGLYIRLCPRGWLHQNQAAIARSLQLGIEAVDTQNLRVNVAEATAATDAFLRSLEHQRMTTYLAGMVVPNFTRASLTATKNQTLINQAQVACALERYHHDHAGYPETLTDLAPRYLERLPHDVTTGQPLKYQRAARGYQLYSVGWNGKDDGGVADEKSGRDDWAWPHLPRR